MARDTRPTGLYLHMVMLEVAGPDTVICTTITPNITITNKFR